MNKDGRVRKILLLLVGIGLVGAMAWPAWAGSLEVRTTNGAKMLWDGSVMMNMDYGPGVFDWGNPQWDGVNRWVVEFNVGDLTSQLGAGESFQVYDARLDLRIKTNSGSPGDAIVGHIVDDGIIDSTDYNSAMDYANVAVIPGTTPNNTTLNLGLGMNQNSDLYKAMSDDLNAGRVWHSYRVYLADETITPEGAPGNASSYYQIPVPDPIQTTGNNTSPRLRIWYNIVTASAPKNPGDVDEDGFVGGADLTQILTNWGNSGVSWTDGDVDPYNDGITTGDDFIGGGDYTEVLTFWGTSYPPEGTAVPEPASLGLLLIGVLPWLRRRK